MKLAGHYVNVLVGGYPLTADSNSISITDEHTQHDVSAFGDAAHNFVNGQRKLTIEHKGFLNAATDRSHPVLKGHALEDIISVCLGQNTDPANGDPMFSMDVLQGQYQSMPEVNNAIPFTAQFVSKGKRGGWGVALAVPVDITNSTNGSVVNHGSATSNGGAVFLHILQAAVSDTYSITVEGSTTGAFASEETTLATFTLDGSSVNAERIVLYGSVPQYTRWTATRTGSAGDTLTLAINLVRF